MNDKLGRGLEALIRDIDEHQQQGTGITTVPIDKINPNRYQPRKQFDPEKLAELTASIKENGIIQPIVVTKTEDSDYELIAGERRLAAAKLAGLYEVPVIVRCVSAQEQLQLALIENIQREDLNPIEEANAYLQLLEEFNMTHAQISQIVAKDRSTITNSLRLLKLSEPIQQMIIKGTLTSGHARAILSVPDNYQLPFAEYIVQHSLSVRAAEEKAKTFALEKSKSTDKPKNSLFKTYELQISQSLSAKTKIIDKGGKGKIVIQYKSSADLDTLLKKLTR